MPRHVFSSIARSLLLLSGLGLVAGCSSRKLMYQYGETLLVYEISRALDLEAPQKRHLRDRIHAHFVWHRAEELPLYADRIEQLRQRFADGLSDEDMRWTRGTIEELLGRVARRLAPDAGAILATLDAQQIDHLQGSMDDRGGRRTELLDLPAAKYVDKRTIEMTKTLVTWLGPLAPAQTQLVEAHVRRTRDDMIAQRASGQRAGQEFLALLRRHPGAAAITKRILSVFDSTPAATPDEAADQALRQRVQTASEQLALALERSATPEQRRHFDAELVSLRDDLRSLVH